MNKKIRELIKNILVKFGRPFKDYIWGKPPLPMWDYDQLFNGLMKQIAPNTLVGKTSCFNIYQLAKQVGHLPGDVAEVGVYKGGTAKLLCKIFESKNKVIHLFDTFSGMPLPNPSKDLHKQGDFSDTSFSSVKNFLSDCNNKCLYEGFFPTTAKPIEKKAFCFIHIDVDIYQSVLDCCEFFYPRMVKGGIMVFDDYGFLSCPGAKVAVDEFFSDKEETLFYLPTGQCVVIHI